jgi:hypothetical protein
VITVVTAEVMTAVIVIVIGDLMYIFNHAIRSQNRNFNIYMLYKKCFLLYLVILSIALIFLFGIDLMLATLYAA